jgi:hypothetical protein
MLDSADHSKRIQFSALDDESPYLLRLADVRRKLEEARIAAAELCDKIAQEMRVAAKKIGLASDDADVTAARRDDP